MAPREAERLPAWEGNTNLQGGNQAASPRNAQRAGSLISLARLAVTENGGVSRNVVTVVPRMLVLPTRRNREAQRRVELGLEGRYRARRLRVPKQLEIDFPKRQRRRAAKEEVARELDRLEPRWRRLFVLYPTESSLRERGE